MKNAIGLSILLFWSITIFSQNTAINALQVEENGYFTNIKPSQNGFVFTDNYCNSLYYLENGNITELVSAPGCGRYFNISQCGNYVGFKLIDNRGQTPAVINLNNKKIEELHEPAKLCGQPVFANQNIAFTIYDNLIIKSPEGTKTYKLNTYSNIVAISADLKFAAFSANDQIAILDLQSEKCITISESGKLSSYPQFSPDSKKLMFQSDEIYVYEIETNILNKICSGLYPQWSQNSMEIVFYNTETDDYQLFNSDLYLVNYQNKQVSKITETENIFEMQAVFINEHELVYHTYNSSEIYKLNITSGEKTLVYQPDSSIEIKHYSVLGTKAEISISGTVPYTHQVYDTPNAHYGNGSCAPACAIMAISYYNKLPKWPTLVTKLYPHISDYGSYVSTRYRLNEYYFENTATTSGGDVAYGGYGFMWGLGSPNSQMRNYMINHYFESSQLWNNSVTWTSVLAEIDADYPLPMCAMLSSAGHLILTKGYIVGQRTLIFSEPYGDKNTPSWPSYDGHKVYYDWPGYNNGYQNLDFNGSYGVIAWTVTAHAQQQEYNDTIIDDIYYHHGFEMNNSQNGSTMRYFRDQNTGYNNHSWWTNTEATSNDICWVRWIPTLEHEGFYSISAYIPSTNASAENAPYKIYHSEGLNIQLVNQNEYNDEWVNLGTYKYVPNQNFYVYLGDSTGIGSQPIAYDAVKFDRIYPPIASFSTNQTEYCINEIIQIDNLSQNYVSCEWEFPEASEIGGTIDNPTVVYSQAGTYSAKLICYGAFENDTIEFENFININEPAVANFTVNSYELYLPNAIAIFNNQSQNAESYLWEFGNGQSSTDVNPYCLYDQAGEYTVSLTAYANSCPESVFTEEQQIIVNLSTKINKLDFDNFNIYPNPASDFITIPDYYHINTIKIITLTGQTVMQIDEPSQATINIKDLTISVYNIQITDKDGIVYNKFIVVN